LTVISKLMLIQFVSLMKYLGTFKNSENKLSGNVRQLYSQNPVCSAQTFIPMISTRQMLVAAISLHL
jgi:hypothetical protein